MSGHSHFSSIKHKKELEDQKRGKIFSKIARQIIVAVRQKGPNPETNYELKMVMEKAKSFNMPKVNIERAIQKGTGQGGGNKLEEFTFEGYGPGGIALIIEGITDNKKRSLSEIKQILDKNGGKLVGEGSVKWMFQKQGIIEIDSENQTHKTKDDLELDAIESGAQDTRWEGNILEVYTLPQDLEKVKQQLEDKGDTVESSNLGWVAAKEISIEDKQYQTAEKLLDALDDNDDVQNVYSNLKLK